MEFKNGFLEHIGHENLSESEDSDEDDVLDDLLGLSLDDGKMDIGLDDKKNDASSSKNTKTKETGLTNGSAEHYIQVRIQCFIVTLMECFILFCQQYWTLIYIKRLCLVSMPQVGISWVFLVSQHFEVQLSFCFGVHVSAMLRDMRFRGRITIFPQHKIFLWCFLEWHEMFNSGNYCSYSAQRTTIPCSKRKCSRLLWSS